MIEESFAKFTRRNRLEEALKHTSLKHNMHDYMIELLHEMCEILASEVMHLECGVHLHHGRMVYVGDINRKYRTAMFHQKEF